MKQVKTLAYAAALALALSATGVRAADGAKADKPDAKPEKTDKRERKAEVSKPDKRTLEHIELLNGKPLNEEQSKSVQAAWEKRDTARKAADDAFKTEIAQSLGMTPEQIAAKEKELRDAAKKDSPDGAKKEGAAGVTKDGEAGAKKDGDKPAAR